MFSFFGTLLKVFLAFLLMIFMFNLQYLEPKGEEELLQLYSVSEEWCTMDYRHDVMGGPFGFVEIIGSSNCFSAHLSPWGLSKNILIFLLILGSIFYFKIERGFLRWMLEIIILGMILAHLAGFLGFNFLLIIIMSLAVSLIFIFFDLWFKRKRLR